jgi:hypothetical protein
MNRKLMTIIALQAFLIVMLFWLLVYYGKDEFEAAGLDIEEEIETPNRVASQDGQTVITIREATQLQSGIKINPLKAGNNQASVRSYGIVTNIDPLLELRTRYLSAKAEANIVRATLANSKLEYNRLSGLNEDNKNISDKMVANAATTIRTEEARIIAAEASAKNIANTMQQQWGGLLTQLATNSEMPALLQSLVNQQQVLVQITLPFDAIEPETNSTINISPITAASHKIKATFISRAPNSSTSIPGKTYFYAAKTDELRAGMQVNAVIPQQKNFTQGVIIPNTAVVWYGGQPWVYKKIEDDQFLRLSINTDVETDIGWFYTGNLKENDEIVTRGAQLLLSEEFKYQITNENDD